MSQGSTRTVCVNSRECVMPKVADITVIKQDLIV